MTFEEIISTVQTCSITDDNEFDLFIDDISVSADALNLSMEQRAQLIEQLLLNMEHQPEPEFTSWSLIHFIEWLDEDTTTTYNLQILKSLQRKPRFITLLLANRILNGLADASNDRVLFLSALKDIASDETLDEYIRNEANGFYEYQMNKEG